MNDKVMECLNDLKQLSSSGDVEYLDMTRNSELKAIMHYPQYIGYNQCDSGYLSYHHQ